MPKSLPREHNAQIGCLTVFQADKSLIYGVTEIGCAHELA